MQEFLNMGGYAAYVWSSVSATLVVLLLNVYLARRHQRNAIARARKRQRRRS
ncbi:MAG: heme exporter protein CcmD [Gammaproteobacteria bacterium]|nr:heme exporter protein CcmD [Gammaproteobacteria bacterium]